MAYEYGISWLPGYSFVVYKLCNIEDFLYLSQTWYWSIVIGLTTGTAICVCCGFVLNIIVFYLLNKHSSKAINLTLCFIAIVDNCVLIINGLDAFCHLMENFVISQSTGIHLAYFHTLLWIPQASVITTRNWSMIFMCLSRVMSIVFPIKSRVIFTRKFNLICLLSLATFISLSNTIKFAEINGKFSNCSDGLHMNFGSSSYLSTGYTWATSVVFNSLLPVVACIVFNSILIYHVRKAQMFRYLNSTTRVNDIDQNKGTKIVLSLSAVFIVCQIPMTMYGIIVMFKFKQWQFTLMNLVGTLLNNIDSSCNFYIYLATNASFRSDFKKIFLSFKTIASEERDKTETLELQETSQNVVAVKSDLSDPASQT